MNLAGRPADLRRLAYAERFGVKPTRRNFHKLQPRFMDQLGRCKTDEARRLLLGVSR